MHDFLHDEAFTIGAVVRWGQQLIDAVRPDIAWSRPQGCHAKVMITLKEWRIGMADSSQASVEKRLRDHGVNPTPQRVEIGLLLLTRPRHMSADQILVDLRAAGSGISKATVYNTLNLFSEKGIAREVAVDPKRLVYDSTVSVHHHFFNVDTGELTDIDSESLEIKGLPELPHGTVAESVELIIRVRGKT
jgi:Fur family iron response transcriptional regulator